MPLQAVDLLHKSQHPLGHKDVGVAELGERARHHEQYSYGLTNSEGT